MKSVVVLVHGLIGEGCTLAGRADAEKYWNDIPAALAALGVEVVTPTLPHKASVADRARALSDYLNSLVYPRVGKIHLMAHSMGGLDCRYLITHLGWAPRAASLTTVGTPHSGTPLASLLNEWETALEFLGAAATPQLSPKDLGVDLSPATRDLAVEACRVFNATTPDSPAVRYYAVAGQAQALLGSVWAVPTYILFREEGASDGLVSVLSARPRDWPGEVWDDTTHAGLLGWPAPFGDGKSRAEKWAELARRALDAEERGAAAVRGPGPVVV